MPTVIGKNVLLVDATEGSEIETVGYEITHNMPIHMRKVLAKNAKKEMFMYESVRFDEGVDGLAGLVGEEDDEDEVEDKIEEIESHIREVLTKPELRRSVIGMRPDFVITLAAV